MVYYCKQEEARRIDSGNGHWSYPLLDERNGCINSCASGISYYSNLEFIPPAVHPFQEGFLVLEGFGKAHVGDQIFYLEPHMSFLVPSGIPHSLKCENESSPLKLFWFHAGV